MTLYQIDFYDEKWQKDCEYTMANSSEEAEKDWRERFPNTHIIAIWEVLK